MSASVDLTCDSKGKEEDLEIVRGCRWMTAGG